MVEENELDDLSPLDQVKDNIKVDESTSSVQVSNNTPDSIWGRYGFGISVSIGVALLSIAVVLVVLYFVAVPKIKYSCGDGVCIEDKYGDMTKSKCDETCEVYHVNSDGYCSPEIGVGSMSKPDCVDMCTIDCQSQLPNAELCDIICAHNKVSFASPSLTRYIGYKLEGDNVIGVLNSTIDTTSSLFIEPGSLAKSELVSYTSMKLRTVDNTDICLSTLSVDADENPYIPIFRECTASDTNLQIGATNKISGLNGVTIMAADHSKYYRTSNRNEDELQVVPESTIVGPATAWVVGLTELS